MWLRFTGQRTFIHCCLTCLIHSVHVLREDIIVLKMTLCAIKSHQLTHIPVYLSQCRYLNNSASSLTLHFEHLSIHFGLGCAGCLRESQLPWVKSLISHHSHSSPCSYIYQGVWVMSKIRRNAKYIAVWCTSQLYSNFCNVFSQLCRTDCLVSCSDVQPTLLMLTDTGNSLLSQQDTKPGGNSF